MIPRTWRYITPYVCAISSIVLGVTIAIGWLLHSLALTQLSSSFAPMHFNTAMCFIVSGIAFLLLLSNQQFISRLFSTYLTCFALVTLCQYVFHFHLGIDELMIKDYINVHSLYPGRMAPSTALSFTLMGFSFLILSWSLPKHCIPILLFIFLLIFSISILALIGYVNDFTTHFGLGQLVKMTFYAAVGLMVLNVGSIFYVLNENQLSSRILVPFLVSFLIVNVSFLSWQIIKKNQEEHLNSTLLTKINNVSILLQTYFEERANAFNRIAYRWLNHPGGTPKKEWEADVLHYIHDQPGYTAIEWVDANFIVRWVAPEQSNERTLGFNLFQEAHRRQQIERVLATNTLLLSNQLDLIQGGKGILFFAPLKKDNQFQGLIVGVMNSQQLFANLAQKLDLGHFYLTIQDQNEILYSNTKAHKQSTWEKELPLNLYGQTWQLRLSPNDALLNNYLSPLLPTLALIIGLFIAILAGFLTRSVLSIKKLQQVAQNAHERLQGIIEGSTDYIAAIDLNYNFIAFNSIYRSEVYRLFQIDLKPGMNLDVLLKRMSHKNQQKLKFLWKRALEGKSFTVIESFKDKGYKDLDYEIHYNPIFNADKRLIGASHIATNIHQRVTSEQQLVAYSQQLEQLIKDLENQNKELNLLKEFSNVLQTNSTLEQAMEVIHNYISKLLVDTSGALYLIAHEEDEIAHEMFRWGNLSIDHREFNSNDCIAILRHQYYFVADRNEKLMCKHIQASNNNGSYLCLPFFVQKKLLGLLYLELSSRLSHNQRLIPFAQIVAEQIALNLYNIQLRETLKIQSIKDNLTGLYNRKFFEEYLQKEINKSKRIPTKFGILLIDIDFFKSINDSYGHLAGDKALIELAKILTSTIRESDLVARWGGEEFIIFLREISLPKIRQKAEKLRLDVEKSKIKLHHERISFTISIGIAFFDDEIDKDLLIKKADDALYQAKNSGRNKVIVNAYDQL